MSRWTAWAEGNEMASDSDWVEDVKRWYQAGVKSSRPDRASIDEYELDALGYEAAHPALQARHWPGASTTGFGDSR